MLQQANRSGEIPETKRQARDAGAGHAAKAEARVKRRENRPADAFLQLGRNGVHRDFQHTATRAESNGGRNEGA